MPLPEGVPEEVPVNCNGRSALLVIRTQRVLFNDQDMSASKFEALCGKGDAKKWKCSLWLEDEEGEPVMVSHWSPYQVLCSSAPHASGNYVWVVLPVMCVCNVQQRFWQMTDRSVMGL